LLINLCLSSLAFMALLQVWFFWFPDLSCPKSWKRWTHIRRLCRTYSETRPNADAKYVKSTPWRPCTSGHRKLLLRTMGKRWSSELWNKNYPCNANITTFKRAHQCFFHEHLWELRVSQRQGPETEVRGCVRDASQDELNGFDHLMHEDLTWGMLLIGIDRVHVSEHFSLCLIGLDLVRGLDVFELIIVIFVGEYRVTELNKIYSSSDSSIYLNLCWWCPAYFFLCWLIS